MSKELRCHSPVHNVKGAGSILLVHDNKHFYAHCGDRGCKRWTKIILTIPGVGEVSPENAVFETELMPNNFVFNGEYGKKMQSVQLISKVEE